MKKLNNKGIGFLGVLLVILVLAATGGAGVYVYHKNHKSKTTSSTSSSSSTTGTKKGSMGGSTTSDPYAEWKTYSNNQVHFRYPTTWTAGPRQSTVATTTSSAYMSSGVETAANPGSSIDLFLQLSTDTATIDCTDAPCEVIATLPLNNSQLSGAVLAVVNQTSGNGTKFTEYVVARGATKAGDTSVVPVKLGTSNIYVFGQPEYETQDQGMPQSLAARVTDVNSFQADANFKDLVTLIDSIGL